MTNSGFFNVWLLAVCNALAFSATPLIMLVGSLIGTELAPSTDWATLPIATMVVGTAMGILPATNVMKYLGRKMGLLLFIGLGVISCALASYALTVSHFFLFCFSSLLLGVTNAALQQIRFVAIESVALNKSATAASVIMCGGIASAVLGPELAVIGRFFTKVEYQGSFWLVAGTFILAGALLLFLRSPKPVVGTSKTSKARALGDILENPAFLLAVGSATVGFLVMTFVMTGTPISMHHHMGHSLEDTKWVIQAHIAAMFLPSLVTPWLFRWLGIQGVMLAGLCCYGLTIVVGLLDNSVMGYWYQLVALGVGWNFLFVSGTALLPRTYLPGDQYKAQGVNDLTVFSFQAIASLTAGFAVSMVSWQTLLLVCLIPIVLLVLLLVKIRWAVKPACRPLV